MCLQLVSETVPAGLGVFPQGLKPALLLALDGVASAVQCQDMVYTALPTHPLQVEGCDQRSTAVDRWSTSSISRTRLSQ